MIPLLLAAATTFWFGSPDTLLVGEKTVGTFQHATRVVSSPQGWVYVIDAERNLVVSIDAEGVPRSSVGGYGWSPTAFDLPTGVSTDGLNLYVSDHGNHRIQRFDRSLNFISSFSTRDTSFLAARFGYPLGLALSRLGDLFVIDGENLRVLKFDAVLRFERSFGGIEDERSTLRNPLKIMIAPDDLVYVLEPGRLLAFDYFGHFVRAIGASVVENAKGFCLYRGGVIVVAPDRLFWFNDRGEHSRTVLSREILSDPPLGSMEDVASLGERLLVLTTSRLHIIQVSLQAE